jgi:hypothetical protein
MFSLICRNWVRGERQHESVKKTIREEEGDGGGERRE